MNKKIVEIIPVLGLPEFKKNDDLLKILKDALKVNKLNLVEGDVLIITQKIISKIEDMINTVVRQISFFEFEKLVHNERKNIELSADQISDFWMTTQSESLGPHIKLSEGYKNFWTYIPHFIHTPFYVYAYAFGDCLVNILIQLYDEGLPNFKDHYIDLLKSGGSKHYSEVLKPFNVDLTNQQSWQKGLSMISGLIDEFEKSL